jgi:hypothetical protein
MSYPQNNYRPPTEDTYLRGYGVVVKKKLGPGAIEDLLKIPKEGIGEPWQTMLQADLNVCTLKALAIAEPFQQKIVKDAVGTVLTEHTGLTNGQVLAVVDKTIRSGVTAADVAAVDATTETMVSWLPYTQGWKDLEAHLQGMVGTCADFRVKALGLKSHSEEQVKAQQALADACAIALRTAKARAAVIRLDNTLQLSLVPLADHISAMATTWEALIPKLNGAAAEKVVRSLLRTRPVSDTQTSDVDALFWDLQGSCTNLNVRLDHLVRICMGDATLQRFAKILTGRRRNGLTSMLQNYGGRGFLALCPLDAEQCGTALDRFGNLSGTFLQYVPADSPETLITAFLLRSIEGPDSNSGEKAVMRVNTRIELKDAIKTAGWQPVNGFDCPKAFSIESVETDAACIKHVVEEVGHNPSSAKLARYFIEMAEACLLAGKQWNSSHSNLTIKPPGGVATWHISIGVQGKKIVHHIDSGYAKSLWRDAPN